MLRYRGRKVFLNPAGYCNFDLLVLKGNKLKYCIAFHFLTPEDIVYYVIFVFEQLNLNPERNKPGPSRNVDRFSPVFDLLFRYIRNIEFLSRNEGFQLQAIYSTMFRSLLLYSSKSILMRIITGKFRGKQIHPPVNLPVRPTTDFAKESLFNILNNLVDIRRSACA